MLNAGALVETSSGPADATWYKDAIIYELPVRAFYDSDGDGIGDFRGLISKLDYLQDLGVTALWLLPFYPSPGRDDGYDISDYYEIHPSYGTLRDFKAFLREARWRGLKVITELVLNHTSDAHPWFQRSRRARRGSSARDYYVWNDTADAYREARIIFKDFESSNWAPDPTAGAYYWHRFYSHQPDLNYQSRQVRRAMLQVVDFWFEMGVDGLRLDAVPYLFEREGTSCENLPDTHGYLKELRAHVDARFENRMLLAEANQWPEDSVTYFGDGDECHMAFHFPVMPRMFMAIRQEDRFPIVDIMAQTPPIPGTCQWAVFLRNHDELTLEMVTDEERDYMYRAYSHDRQARINLGIRRRLAPLLGGDRKTVELMNGLLFSLPGTPVIYYGDEIGMGDNIYLGDRNGVRTPMQWSTDRNAGFSRANPQKLYLPVIIDPEYHAEAVNVEAQQNNPNSLLWWMKRLVALRKRHRAFGRGSIEFLQPANRKILAFLRSYEEERLLVVANLSRLVQYVQLDLSEFRGMVPVEVFGQTELPAVRDEPYFLTLGPHAFYWFALVGAHPVAISPRRELPVLNVKESLQDLLEPGGWGPLEQLLPAYVAGRRWFGGKARAIRSTTILDSLPISDHSSKIGRDEAPAGYLTLVQVDYLEGDPETYVLPLASTPAQRVSDPERAISEAAIARVRTKDGDQMLFDATYDSRFCRSLLDTIARRRHAGPRKAKLVATRTEAFHRIVGRSDALSPSLMGVEQSNTSVRFGYQLLLKLFRRVGEGVNPDLEIGRFLTERRSFPHTPAVAGALEYHRSKAEPITLGILHAFISNGGDAWRYTLDHLSRYLEEALIRRGKIVRPELPNQSPLAVAFLEPPPLACEMMAEYLEAVRLLGVRTAEVHIALASEVEDPAFAPEDFTPFYQRSLYQSMRTRTIQTFRLLKDHTDRLPEVNQILDLEGEILKRFKAVLGGKIEAKRIRCHGDYHLGQVLHTGNDFLIIDFEGEPARPLSERRIKRSPLQDVAGMLRSFHYAAYSALYGATTGFARPDDPSELELWIRFWYVWAAAGFLGAYLDQAKGAGFLPTNLGELEVLLDFFLLGKAVYELGYEANSRPDWIKMPIQGVLQLLEPHSD